MRPANSSDAMYPRLARTLRARGYVADARLEARADAFVATVHSALADRLTEDTVSHELGPAAALAFDRARDASALASPTHHEAWGRAALLYAARDAVRLAEVETDFDELREAGAHLAHAADARIAPRGGTGAIKLHAVDDVTRAARKALAEARDKTLPGNPLRTFGSALYEQLGAALPLLSARGAKPGPVIANAVRNADEASRKALAKHGVTLPEHRRLLAVRALHEAAAVLASSAIDALDVNTERDDAALWLLRATAAMSACAINAPNWIPDEAAAATPAAGHETATATTNTTTATTAAPSNQDTRAMSNPATAASNGNASATSAAQRGRTEASMKDPTTIASGASPMQHPIIKTLQVDATDAAWRTAGSQLLKLTREPLVGLLQRHLAPGDDAFRARVAAFLETELGGALVASCLSLALGSMPNTAGEVPQRLARELRVRAMSDTGDLVADVLMGPLRQVIAMYLQDPSGALMVAPAQGPMALPEADPRASLAGTFQNAGVGAGVEGNGPTRG